MICLAIVRDGHVLGWPRARLAKEGWRFAGLAIGLARHRLGWASLGLVTGWPMEGLDVDWVRQGLDVDTFGHMVAVG
jgi:hypothetical protein